MHGDNFYRVYDDDISHIWRLTPPLDDTCPQPPMADQGWCAQRYSTRRVEGFHRCMQSEGQGAAGGGWWVAGLDWQVLLECYSTACGREKSGRPHIAAVTGRSWLLRPLAGV